MVAPFRPQSARPASHGRRRAASVVAVSLQRWFQERAAGVLAGSIALWSPAVGQEPRAVLVRNQRRLWGSCSADGTLRFNWRLVQLEPSLLDYVVVHELSHLNVRNHSAVFWSEVGRVQPDYPALRRRLRKAGALVVL